MGWSTPCKCTNPAHFEGEQLHVAGPWPGTTQGRSRMAVRCDQHARVPSKRNGIIIDVIHTALQKIIAALPRPQGPIDIP